MAYVRRRGNQLAIVAGEREIETGNVQQRILFTLYSKAEALEALGRRQNGGGERFRLLIERQHPEIRFNWKKICHAIEQNLDALPDLYEYRSERLRSRFRNDLCAFTRSLILAEPYDLIPSARLIQEHRHELEYLRDLISWRLEHCDQKETEWNTDNPFYWRFSLQGREVPSDIEEHASELYRHGEYERAEAIFQLLVECFDRYAEGYNYLGLISLELGRLDEAIKRFERTIELGRRLFPARIKKDRYWSDLSTRPYMRGLRNLALALNQAGRFDPALSICDKLESECGDEWTSTWHRATVYLNTRRWREAADAAEKFMGTQADAGFVTAFALFELGEVESALSDFIYASLNHPRAARMLAGGRKRPVAPASYDEVEDHNAGVSLLRGLHAYLNGRSHTAQRFFRGIMNDPRVGELLDEVVAVVRRRHEQHPTGKREAFDRMQLMHSREFAIAEARKLRVRTVPSGGLAAALAPK